MREDFFDALSGYFFDDKVVSDEKLMFNSKEDAMKAARKMGLGEVHSHKDEDGNTLWMPGKDMKQFREWQKKKETGSYRYENPKTGEVFTYRRKGIYRKDGTVLIYKGKTNGSRTD
jgi:hypothetical protein